jgi:hypothetical protein
MHMLSQTELEDLIRKTIQLYNRTHSPQAVAKLVQISPLQVTVSFSGGFCYGCGVMDYVDAFALDFKVLSGSAELKAGKTRQVNPRTFEADYAVKNK